eukprot:gene25718-30889_t
MTPVEGGPELERRGSRSASVNIPVPTARVIPELWTSTNRPYATDAARRVSSFSKRTGNALPFPPSAPSAVTNTHAPEAFSAPNDAASHLEYPMNSAPAYDLDVDIDGTYQITHTKQDIAAADTAYAMLPAYDVLVEQSHGRELEVDLTAGLELLKSLTTALETLMVLQPDHEATVEYRKAQTARESACASPVAEPAKKLEPWANAKPVHPRLFANRARRTNIPGGAHSLSNLCKKLCENPRMTAKLGVDTPKAAAIAKCHPNMIYMALQSGELKGIQRKFKGRWLIENSELEKTLAAVAAISSAALILGGCSSNDTAEEETFKPKSGTQQYDSAQGIADDLAAAGLPCENFTINESTRYATQSATCQIAGEDAVLSVFTSDADQADNIEVFSSLMEPVKMEYGLVAGSKWMINCGDTTINDNCKNIKAQLGGRLIKPTYF